jgi:hypothetical protein
LGQRSRWALSINRSQGFCKDEDDETMRHATMGLKINPLPPGPQVVLGDLYKTVSELSHAPMPLRDMREISYSGSYKHAVRRRFFEMEASGVPFRQIVQVMLEEMPFTLVHLSGELGVLPDGAALEAANSEQTRICKQALLMARRSEVEGFEFHDPASGRPRIFLLESSFSEAVEVIRCDNLVPAHLLPDDLQELFDLEGRLTATSKDPTRLSGEEIDKVIIRRLIPRLLRRARPKRT